MNAAPTASVVTGAADRPRGALPADLTGSAVMLSCPTNAMMSLVIVSCLVYVMFATRSAGVNVPRWDYLQLLLRESSHAILHNSLGHKMLVIRTDNRCVSIITHSLQIHGVCC
jgi:hypothetical protein